MTAILLLAMLAVVPDYQARLEQFRLAQDVPGVSAVITMRGDEIFAGGSGLADIASGRAMSADTVFYAGSLSKILTAVLALELVEQDRLSLDATMPGIATGNAGGSPAITVMQLLTHSSGLEREGDFDYWFSADFPDAEKLADYLATARLRSSPGESVHYSNIGYAALGLAIEGASGMPYADALRARVLLPLGILTTGAPGPTANLATGYTPSGRMIPSESHPFAGVGPAIAGRHVREYHDAAAMTPAFGIYTSARDLGTLARFVLGYGSAEILDDQMRRLMLTPQVPGRGIGLRINSHNGRDVARHDGWFAAHRSHFLLDLDAEIGVVVLANSDSASAREIAESLLELALQSRLRMPGN